MDQVRVEITHRGPAFFVSMRVARAGTTEQIANTFAIGGETKASCAALLWSAVRRGRAMRSWSGHW